MATRKVSENKSGSDHSGKDRKSVTLSIKRIELHKDTGKVYVSKGNIEKGQLVTQKHIRTKFINTDSAIIDKVRKGICSSCTKRLQMQSAKEHFPRCLDLVFNPKDDSGDYGDYFCDAFIDIGDKKPDAIVDEGQVPIDTERTYKVIRC